MKKQKVHYVVILDESGSMSSLKYSVIDLFNEQLQNLQKQSKKIDLRITVSTFNDFVKTINLNAPIDEAQLLNTKNYQPDSLTALYDAILMTYHKLKKHIAKQDRVVFLVLTDGMENSSKEFTKVDVKDLIAKIEKKGGEFNFLCSDIDVQTYKTDMNMSHQASSISFSEDFCLDFSSRLTDISDDLFAE